MIPEIQRPSLSLPGSQWRTTLLQSTSSGRWVLAPVWDGRFLLTHPQILVITVRLITMNADQHPDTGCAALRFPNLSSLDVRSLRVPRMELDRRKRNIQTHNDCTSVLLTHFLQPSTNNARRSTPTWPPFPSYSSMQSVSAI